MAGQGPSQDEPYTGLSAGWIACLTPLIAAFWLAVALLILKLLGIQL